MNEWNDAAWPDWDFDPQGEEYWRILLEYFSNICFTFIALFLNWFLKNILKQQEFINNYMYLRHMVVLIDKVKVNC